MKIEDLFKTRQSVYYRNLGKYMKYVMNDHFVILLLVLGGATGLAYQNYVESIASGAWLPRLFLLLIVMLLFFSGSIRTLVKPADAVFLLPKEKELTKVMTKNLYYSLLVHNLYTIALGFLSLPLLNALQLTDSSTQIYWIGSLVLWKTLHCFYAYYALRQHNNSKEKFIRNSLNFSAFTGVLLSLFISVMIGFFLALASAGVFAVYLFNFTPYENWNWEVLIETEQRRTQKIFSIINMFIDTPYSKHKVKRLESLDFLYNFSVFNKNPEIYYLSRMFVRNYNFSGLYLRLVLIGSIALYFSDNWVINAVMSVLFLYLIGFQLIPLRQAFKKSVYFRLYPHTDTDKINSIQKLIMILLAGSALVYSLAAITSGWVMAVTVLIINSVFIWLFIYGYLPKRLNKK